MLEKEEAAGQREKERRASHPGAVFRPINPISGDARLGDGTAQM